MDKRKKEIRALAEQDLYYFISLVAPERVLGDIHKELITWWNREEAKSHQLVLLPRAHQKSALAAYRVAWEITRNPAVTILYVSSTTPLAINQLRSIKNILTSDKYRTYWPEMINEEEGKREEWAAMRFCVDHPKRKKEGVRDSTVMASGITTNLTGFHCDIAVLDDIITKDNAYSEMGREQVKSFYSFMASIENTDASEWVIGTRYHPKDLYDKLIQMRYIIREPETGGILSDEPMFDVFARVVENSDERNGTGQFLWPSQKRYDGRTFGFDVGELAKKKAQYDDMAKFYSQYYNDPTDPSEARITPACFQYYNPKHLKEEGGVWFLKERRLNIFAGMDFAYSLDKRADNTAIVIIGVDEDNNIYILDIDVFKTTRISVMRERLLALHRRWNIKKVCAETNMGQKVIVEQFKEDLSQEGVILPIESKYRTRHEGTKLERVTAVLQLRYFQKKIWHFKGYNCQTLESELQAAKPDHDDIEDALASAIEISKAPFRSRGVKQESNIMYHSKFGGVM